MQFSFDPTTTEVALTPKPFIPTFESVLARNGYTLRLPTYRSSYGRRFHPYPRYPSPRIQIDDLMTTIDHRYDDTGSVSTLNLDDEDSPETNVNTPEPTTDGDKEKSIVEAKEQAVAIEQVEAREQAEFARFSLFVVDLALYIRRVLNGFRVRRTPSLAKD